MIARWKTRKNIEMSVFISRYSVFFPNYRARVSFGFF